MVHQVDFVHASVTSSKLSVALTASHVDIDRLNFLARRDTDDPGLLAEASLLRLGLLD